MYCPSSRSALSRVQAGKKGFLYAFLSTCILPLLLLFPSCLLAASASCTLPYGGMVSLDTVRPIAKSAAYMAALPHAVNALRHNKAMTFGLDSAEQREALAAAAHRPSFSIRPTPQPADDKSTDSAKVRVDAQLATAPRTLHNRVRLLIGLPDVIDIRMQWLEVMRSAAEESRDLALRAADLRAQYGPGAEQSVDERLAWLGKRLEALWLLDEALVYYPGVWKEAPKALRLLQKAVQCDSDNALVWALLAEVQLQMDRPQQALESCSAALRLNPDFARALFTRGLGHLRLQQPALAEADFSAALRLKPEQTAWLRARGAARMVREDHGPMCEDFAAACALGDCEGLSAARKRGLCLPKSMTSDPLNP